MAEFESASPDSLLEAALDEIRRLGDRTLGRYLFRFEDGTWRGYGGGGSMFMFLGSLHVNHYEDWLLKDQPDER